MKIVSKIFVWLFISSIALGFRVFPGKWNITKSDPTVWVKRCSSTVTIDENDITGNDPLSGLSGLTIDKILQSVIDDYNNSPTSFLRLALYPIDPSNPGTPAAGDSTFTIATAEKRTIEICFDGTDSSAGLSSGHSQTKNDGSTIVGCTIKINPTHTKKANFLTHLVTHEVGHCFGLMHPQESTNAVMSYFNTNGVFIRLQNDDEAGLAYRYPEDESYNREESTFGVTGCSPK